MVLLLFLAVLAGIGAAVWAAVRWARGHEQTYDAQNEILPGVPSRAPKAWGGAHSPEALLHRRLVAAVHALRVQSDIGAERIEAMDLRVELEQHALAVDDRLIAASALPQGHREQAIAEVEVSVVAIEGAAADLARGLAQTGTSSDVRGLEDLSARIKGMTAEG